MKQFFLGLFLCVAAVCASAQTYERTAHGIKAHLPEQGVQVEVQWFTPSIVRILKTPVGKPVIKKSLSVIAQPQEFSVDYSSSASGKVVMKTRKMQVELDLQQGNFRFADVEGIRLLNELSLAPAFISFNDAGRATYSVYQAFQTDRDEGLYGLGQLQNGKMMQRNMKKHLVQGNVEDVTPIFQSTKGYAVFWDNYSGTTYTDNEQETSFRSEVGDCVDYYFLYGGSADGVIAGIRELTGSVPMMPLWSYGFMQSKERYKSQEETVGVVKKYRELGIPLDCIIQDWQYWGHNYLWNAMDFQNPAFSRPRDMIDQIHAMHAHMMISIWSSFGPATKPYRALDKEGLLFDMETWPQSGVDGWPPNMEYPSGVRVYDAYSAKARDIYWDHLNKGIFQLGMDGWWMDSTEPDHFNHRPEDFDRQTAMGSYRSVRNAYPLLTVGGVYDHQRAVTSDKRVIILTRSGFLGQQRYGSNVWSGDVQSTWDNLRRQLTAGLNFSLTGMPHWNSDLGGFFAGAYNRSFLDDSATRNPLYQELYVRWTQFGVFCPMMRSHGADVSREFYKYGSAGDPVYEALVHAVKLRYSLLPYIYSTAWQVSRYHSTFMRALFMDFPNDRKGWDMGSEYMFGPSLLVAPVLHAQYTPEQTTRELKENEGWGRNLQKVPSLILAVDFKQEKQSEVYLPEGTVWYDFWTQKKYEGGQKLTLTTTLNSIPLFVRAGGILPIGPDVQYTGEKKWDVLTVRVYPGADGTFTLYEDEGDNYNYESGFYSEITFNWNDAKRTLTIENRKNAFEGMLQQRSFVIETPDGVSRTVSYVGKKIRVKL